MATQTPSVNAVKVLNFLKENFGKEFTKRQIADALNISISAVTGTINSLQKPEKGYVITTRTEDVVEQEATETRKAKIKTVPYHTLTEAGLAYDPVAEAEAKAAAKEAEKAAKKAAREAAKAAKEA